MVYQELNLAQLEADPRNANVCDEATLEKLARHLAQGRCPALIVRPHPQKVDQYILIDGHHRHRVLERLGKTTAPCEIWSVDEQEAGLLLATLNRLRGEDNPRKRAELLDSLLVELPLPDLALLVPETESQIQDLLSLLTLEEQELERRIQAQLAEEAAGLPVMLHFLLPSAAEAELVRQALAATGEGDEGRALVTLCRQALPPQAADDGEATEVS